MKQEVRGGREGEGTLKRICAMAGLALVLATQVSAADGAGDQALAIQGSVDTTFDGIPSDGISVEINGTSVELDGQGAFAAAVPIAPYFQLRIAGAPIHTAVQTFGIAELYEKACDCLRVPPIQVVARKPERIELFFAGDAMAGRRYVEPIWGERQLVDPGDPLPDIKALLEPVRPYVETADLASVNLEIVLSERDFGNAPPKSVTFYSPPELAEALAGAGFDHVTLGNNHAYDFLEEGLASTIAAVEAAGLGWSGAGHEEKQALEASRIEIGGQPLSLLGYVGWKGNVEPNQVAEEGKGGAAFGSDENIAATVSRETALGRTAVAQYHGSREYSDGPTEESERRMKLAVDSGAAVIASHHPHVPQGVEIYKGALIAYSSGNFLFDQYFLETHGAFALRVWLDNGVFSRAEIIPLRILDYRPVPAVGSMREAVLDRVERLSAKHRTAVLRNGGHGLVLPTGTHELKPTLPTDGLGLDLLRGGDFENAVFGEAVDRSLKLEGGKIEYAFKGAGGNHMKMSADTPGGGLRLATSTFFRVVPGRRVTVSGKVRSDQPFRLGIASQERPSGMGRFAALEGQPFEDRIGRDFAGGDQWQRFTLSFDIGGPDGPGPFRPRLEFLALDPDSEHALVVDLDDLRVVVQAPAADTP